MRGNNQTTAVIASFADRRHADYFVEELRQAGFTDNEIGVMVPDQKSAGTKFEEEVAAGAVSGGVVGVFTGAVATGLIPGIAPVIATGLLIGILGGAAAGAAAGGLLGALLSLSIPARQVRRSEREFFQARTLVVVQALGRGAQALAILRRHEAA